MKNRRIKKPVVYALYALAFVTVMGTIYILEMVSSPSRFIDNATYVDEVILDNEVPVMNVKSIIIRPYLGKDVTIGRNFYNYQDTEENQKNALIYYQDTYIPNSGVDYKSKDLFDVVAILDGTVTKVTENALLGKMVEITHTNNLVSVYQSLGEVIIKENDKILQGQAIGKSGTANISTDLGNHLHFELIHNSLNVNPEAYYDKNLKEL
ncbi:MAG: M23 family metallopeptidase [Bacilli bacterium]